MSNIKESIESKLSAFQDKISFISLNLVSDEPDSSYEHYITTAKYIIPASGEVSENAINEVANIMSMQLARHLMKDAMDSIESASTFEIDEHSDDLAQAVSALPYQKTDYVVGMRVMGGMMFEGYSIENDFERLLPLRKQMSNGESNVYANDSLMNSDSNIDIYNYDEKLDINVATVDIEESTSNDEITIVATAYYKVVVPEHFAKHTATTSQS